MSEHRQRANAIRALSMDAVQQANSGHPGAPMGMADIAEVLWHGFLNHNPQNPHWINRDRFVLSNGHGSMLLYALLHLTGYDVSTEDLRNFRQLHSKTPGHPEFGETPGVETTTGPLGQGIANAVGMALAECLLAREFNRPHHTIIDHYTYAFLGDGCLMEGISHEVCSLAGTLSLGKLIAFWDDNGISIDGEVSGWFTDDTPARFRAYGWQVIEAVDGHDAHAIAAAINSAQQDPRPTLIACRTTIGYGAPNLAGTAKTHGAPLGEAEIQQTRAALQWPHAPFEIPDAIASQWDATASGDKKEAAWQELFDSYQEKFPDEAQTLIRRLTGDLPNNFTQHCQTHIQQVQDAAQSLASRKASLQTLNALKPLLPELLGGSADLTGSNLTCWEGAKTITPQDVDGDYLCYGVREFGMSAIMNGLSLYGGFIPFGGTFLTFVDYARNAVRMAALMQQRCIFIYTHDSIGLGEDGPTHQPVSQAASLRLMPNVQVWRPADAVETAVAWQAALENDQGPSCLLLSRQTLPHQARNHETVNNILRGGYTLLEPKSAPQALIIATGSEVSLAVTAAQQLNAKGHSIRVVSMPCTERFDAQPESYRQLVLPKNITTRVAIEAGSRDYWYKYVGLEGHILGIDQFGASAPAEHLFEHYKLTVDEIIRCIEE